MLNFPFLKLKNLGVNQSLKEIDQDSDLFLYYLGNATWFFSLNVTLKEKKKLKTGTGLRKYAQIMKNTSN